MRGGLIERFRLSERATVLVCLSLLFLTVSPSAAKMAPASTPPASASPSTEATTAEAESPAQKKKTEQYTLPHERYEKAIAYSRARYTLYFISFFYGVLVLVVLLRAGGAAKFRHIAEGVSERRFVQALVFVPLFILTVDILDLPIGIYGHWLSLRYEQSIQHWGSWLWDWSKGELIGIALSIILAIILFAVVRRSPRRWWFYFWLAALPILLLVFFIEPWFIDPLFYNYEALDRKHPGLVSAMEKVVDRAGLSIPSERMFLMEASRKQKAINAYVTGFGASKRVVVWDTTIQKTTTDETLFIFGHEMGHYVLNHVRNGIIFFAGLLLVAFYLSFRGLHWALGRWGTVWKVRGPEDWASLAVMLLLLSVVLFLASPIYNGFSRVQEHNADVYGLEVIRGIVPDSAEVAAHAFQVLGEVDLADPNPPAFVTFWLYSHPPLRDRLVFAHTYDPWSKDESPKYVKQ